MKIFRIFACLFAVLVCASSLLVACSLEQNPGEPSENGTEPYDSTVTSETVDDNIAPPVGVTSEDTAVVLLQNSDMTAKELYLAIHDEKIPYEEIVEYPVFRAEVEQKLSESFGRAIRWEDLSYAIGDWTDMYHYFFWIQDSEETILCMPCAVNAYQDTDGIIKNGLAWGAPWLILGSYTFGDEIIRIDEDHFINKTQLDALFPKGDGLSDYTILYNGIRHQAENIYVPTLCDGKLIYFDINVSPSMQYKMLPGQFVDLMALSPYEFLVTHRAFGLTPQDLMELFPNHPLNPRYVLSDYFDVDDILQSDYRIFSEFGMQPYIRIKDNGQTNMYFGLSLPQTPTGDVLQTADITEETTYQDLAWTLWLN